LIFKSTVLLIKCCYFTLPSLFLVTKFDDEKNENTFSFSPWQRKAADPEPLN